jgi:peptide/nickel transport system permease protein
MKSKIGVIGLVVIAFFVILALFAPQLGGPSTRPVYDVGVAADFSVPAWAVIFPQYRGYAVTGYVISPSAFASTSDLTTWTLTRASTGTATEGISAKVPVTKKGVPVYPGSLQVNATIVPAKNGSDVYLPGGQVFFSLSRQFQWTAKAPKEFLIAALVNPLKMQNVSEVYLNLIVSRAAGNVSLSTVQSDEFVLDQEISLQPSQVDSWHWSNVSDALLSLSGLPGFSKVPPASLVFTSTGTYTFTLQVMGVPTGTNPSISMNIASMSFHEQGNAFGLLGTDNEGRDVWSQLVWGSQISLLIGVASGIGAVALGTLAGLAAGYLGGLSDEILSRVTDFFLVLPFLPLLIIIVLIISQNPALIQGEYFWIILVFVILSWPSIAKIIRSQVLSVKERQYVEASRAVGGGTGHILRKHILPNVMGLVYSQIALNVSGFILLEAALDFLAVSIRPIGTITWGSMLTSALNFAVSDSANGYVWWWFLPPGISIAALSLAFVLVGFALDSVFNPRLRAR